MYVLALETATFPASFALARHGELLLCSRQTGEQRTAETLLAELQDALRVLRISPRQLDVVGVTVGPGSFTGLRCGVAVAKILGYSLGCRIVALGTMQVIARHVEPQEGIVRVVMDAQRNGLYWQQFALRVGSPPEAQQDVQVESVATVQQHLRPDERLFGPGLTRFSAWHPSDETNGHTALAGPQVELVATLTLQAAEVGQFCDPWTLVPRYVGRSAAEDQLPP